MGAVVAVRGRVRPPARCQARLASPTASTVVEVWNKLMSSLTPEHPYPYEFWVNPVNFTFVTPEHPYPYDAPPRTPGRGTRGLKGLKVQTARAGNKSAFTPAEFHALPAAAQPLFAHLVRPESKIHRAGPQSASRPRILTGIRIRALKLYD